MHALWLVDCTGGGIPVGFSTGFVKVRIATILQDPSVRTWPSAAYPHRHNAVVPNTAQQPWEQETDIPAHCSDLFGFITTLTPLDQPMSSSLTPRTRACVQAPEHRSVLYMPCLERLNCPRPTVQDHGSAHPNRTEVSMHTECDQYPMTQTSRISYISTDPHGHCKAHEVSQGYLTICYCSTTVLVSYSMMRGPARTPAAFQRGKATASAVLQCTNL
jgi:hypothetical protein